MPTVRFRILLYPGFDELDAIGPFEVLSMAARRITAAAPPPEAAPAWRVELETVQGALEVTASNGLTVRVAPATDCEASCPGPGPRPGEVLIVPGGGWVDRSRLGAWSEYERGDAPGSVVRLIREAHERGAVLASVCTGAMLLARAGLLRGRRCITHHAAIEDLKTHGALIERERVVDDGEIITAGGVTSGIDLALHLVERFAGAPLAETIAQTLEHDRRRAAFRL